jgi:predicted RNase H-like nuclease
MLGLPKLGKYDDHKDLPFQLLAQDEVPSKGYWVAEVHPAVAMWLWTVWDDPAAASPKNSDLGKYKGKTAEARENRKKLWEKLTKKWRELDLQLLAEMEKDAGEEAKLWDSDDSLDAFIALALILLFFKETKGKNGKRAVKLFGDEKTGAMLLPYHSVLDQKLNPNEMMVNSRRKRKSTKPARID